MERVGKERGRKGRDREKEVINESGDAGMEGDEEEWKGD